MSQWCRLWEDMPNDPKWRVVARRAGRPVSEVLAVFVHMMTNASVAAERGTLDGWDDEDVAIAIDAETEHVAAIREAMQGKTLEDEHLTGWEKRQPLREDNSTDRVRAFRERKQAEREASSVAETHGNITKRTETLEERREDKKDISLSACARFSDFREAYPNQAGMDEAEAAFEDAIAAGADPAAIVEGARRYAAENVGPRAVAWMNAANWLRKGRWKVPPRSNGARASPVNGHARGPTFNIGGVDYPVSELREASAKGAWRTKLWGPPRGHPDCRVPETVFAFQPITNPAAIPAADQPGERNVRPA